MKSLRTARLELVPSTLELAEAEIADLSRFFDLLGCEVSRDWPPVEKRDALAFFLEQHRAGDSSVAGWLGWYVIRVEQSRRLLIGDAGFKGPPVETACVEIGYSILPDYRDLGFATEAVRTLTDWALHTRGVRAVVADVAPGNRASVRVLEKAGFVPFGKSSEAGTNRFRLA